MGVFAMFSFLDAHRFFHIGTAFFYAYAERFYYGSLYQHHYRHGFLLRRQR
jgi:hypothetical protein